MAKIEVEPLAMYANGAQDDHKVPVVEAALVSSGMRVTFKVGFCEPSDTTTAVARKVTAHASRILSYFRATTCARAHGEPKSQR